MSERFDSIVIGAGVIGLAVARLLARAGQDVLVLDQADTHGTGVSARNSEVIHAGLYYPPGGVRARMCVEGRRALYAFCAARGIAAQPCGKLVVAASPEEDSRLDDLAARARQNGVEGLRRLSRSEAQSLEPALHCDGALLSTVTGIVDSAAYMRALRAEAEDAGAAFAFRTPVTDIVCNAKGFTIGTGGADPVRVHCKRLVNAAGLGAVALARRTTGLAASHVPNAYISKGNYFSLAGKSPFRHLIYPLPIPGGAGIHLTLDLAGRARFGPDVEFVDEIDHRVNNERAGMFYAAIRRYWPGLPDGALIPDYAGIRPKIVPPDQVGDWIIQGPDSHGIEGLVNLFGVESPGLTSSLAIADEVWSCLQ